MQALYQWHFTQDPFDNVICQFEEQNSMEKADIDYFQELVKGVIEHLALIDAQLRPCLDRKIAAINPVELAILRLAVYEFMYQPDVPYRVVINEALEIAKEFGAEQGYKYINAVLDAVAPKLRASEVK